jgi:hypothetical protein
VSVLRLRFLRGVGSISSTRVHVYKEDYAGGRARMICMFTRVGRVGSVGVGANQWVASTTLRPTVSTGVGTHSLLRVMIIMVNKLSLNTLDLPAR